MRAIVCGGRDFTDRTYVFRTLDTLRGTMGLSHVIHGGAPGADRLAGAWAIARQLTWDCYPADWKKHGNAAGPMRNAKMLLEGRPETVIAFPGGRGTQDMVDRAERARVPVMRIREPILP